MRISAIRTTIANRNGMVQLPEKVDDRINAIQILATDQLVMTEAGFFEIFVNNDAQTTVYYDNLMVK